MNIYKHSVNINFLMVIAMVVKEGFITAQMFRDLTVNFNQLFLRPMSVI